ncbi:hypothetical protein J3459_014643 [Metarhizium acridum]|nr:hypothetical protein J3459_014643 [Metarhizium acridum]
MHHPSQLPNPQNTPSVSARQSLNLHRDDSITVHASDAMEAVGLDAPDASPRCTISRVLRTAQRNAHKFESITGRTEASTKSTTAAAPTCHSQPLPLQSFKRRG